MPDIDPKQKQFDVLYATLGELQTGLITSTTQVAGFFLLAIGWLATSDTASTLLKSHSVGRRFAATGLGGAYVLYAFGAYMVYRRSQKTFQMLLRVDLMPSDFYSSRVLDVAELAIFILGTFLLFGLAASLVVWPGQ